MVNGQKGTGLRAERGCDNGAATSPWAVAEKRVDLAYDAAGQLVTLTRYADLAGTQLVAQSQYTYDQVGRLRGLSHFRGQTTFVEYTWNFDAANRMTQYINSVDGTADYTSDATGQLTAADYDYQSDESYQYDANGNRVTANGSSYATGMNNQLLSDGTYRYLYDAEGNRTHRFIDTNGNGQLDSGDTDITQYTWEHRNRLVKVQHRSSYGAAVDWVIRYWYDYQNRLVRKLGDLNGDGDYQQKQNLAYDGNQVVMDFRRTGSGLVQTGDLEWRYLWGPAVDQILAEENVDNGSDETVQWTLTDHLNTVRDIAKYDSASDMTTVVNHLIYDAFGKVTSETNPAVDSLFLFTARPFDPDTGLQNNLNRWYDASVGRWLSEDPIEADINVYRYCHNNSVLFVDPYGLEDTGAGDSGTVRNCTRDAIRWQYSIPGLVTRAMAALGLPDVELDGRFYVQIKRCEVCCRDGNWKPSVAGSIGASLYAKGVQGKKDFQYVSFEYGLYFRAGAAGSVAFAYNGCNDKLSGSGCFSVYVEGGLLGQAEGKGGWINVGAGIRGGVNVKSTVCLACAGHTCNVTLQTCVAARFRIWAFLKLETWWSNRKWEYVREYSAEACTPSVLIYSFGF